MSSSLAVDVGQLLWLGFPGTTASPALLARIAAGEVGAVVVFKRNLESTQEVVDVGRLVALTQSLHAAAPPGLPLLIAIDQEGGTVQRVRAPATPWPPMLSFEGHAPPGDETLAREVGRALGRELAALGIDIDFAPVLDVHTNPDNPIIGKRAFAVEPEAAARRALALAAGLADAAVLACGKHFPGHGDTASDSHLELPKLAHAWDRLEAVELLPFRRAIAAGLPMIMTAHVVFSAIDPEVPATLSPKVIDELLRGRMGYRGVIVSDDLGMNAIADHFGIGEAGVRAVAAGCDALLLCNDEEHQGQAREALLRAGTDDAGMRARIAEAAGRVREMKAAHAARRAVVPAVGMDVIGCEEHRRVAERLVGG